MQHPLINYILAVVLFSANIFFPQFGFVLTFFSPIFVLKYLMDERATLREHLAATIITGLFAFYSMLFLAYFVMICVFPAFAVYFIAGKKNNIKLDVVVFGALPAFIFSLLTIFVFTEYKDAIIRYMVAYLDMVISGYEKQGGNFDSNAYLLYLKNNKDAFAYTMVHLMPAFSFSYSALLTVICRKFYFKKANLSEIRYRVNDKLIILFVIGGFFIISSDFNYKLVSYNTLIIFTTLFFLQGLDIINYYFTRWRLSYFLRLILYILIFSEPPVIVLVAIFGLFDTWFDMTKIKLRKSG
jgi:uncharacterized protein YybS (DUF2232 family)